MKKFKKMSFMLVMMLLFGSFTVACAQQDTTAQASQDQTKEKKVKKGILVTSFGTSHNDTRKVTIEAVEEKIAKAFPEYEVKRAFTSNIIIKKLKERDGLEVDTLTQGLEKMKKEGFNEVIVQPLHIIPGAEYKDIVKEISTFNDGSFEKLELGRPILTYQEDYNKAVEAFKAQMPEVKKNQAVVIMGHGTHDPANASYADLQMVFNQANLPVYVGTVEGYPELTDVIRQLKKDNIKEVTLMPYMVVAGDHAKNDMAGEEEDSWKSILEKEGFKVDTYLHGLGENAKYQDIYVQNVKDVIEGKGEKVSPVVQSKEKVKWQEGKKGMLAVSFGTSHNDTRKVTIEAVEEKMKKAFPEYEVRRAFTSNIIINKLKERDGLDIKTPEEALEQMRQDGFEEVMIQPLHIIAGAEYNDLLDVVAQYKETFKKVTVGTPILNTPSDYKKATEALKSQIKDMKKDQAVVVMGHGTHHPANASYACLQSAVKDANLPVYVGTVEGYPTLGDVIKNLKKDGIKEVTLMPYMLVAGDHAKNDMAGEDDESWKSVLEKEGFKVNTYLHGLGENTMYQDMYVEHAKTALEAEQE